MNDTNGVNGAETRIKTGIDEALQRAAESAARQIAAEQSEACAESLRALADRVEMGEIPMQFGVVVFMASMPDGQGELHAKGINDGAHSTPELVGMLSMAANRIGELRP